MKFIIFLATLYHFLLLSERANGKVLGYLWDSYALYKVIIFLGKNFLVDIPHK